MALIQDLIPQSQYATKCPYSMTPKGIVIHNTANDASAKNERDNVARANNTAEVSFHVAIDDIQAVQLIPFNRNTWNAGDGGNGQGNRNYISIEICYSLSGGTRFINAEKRTAKEVALLLKQYNWTLANVKKHQDFSGKYCPHRTLDGGWQRFLNMIQAELNSLNNIKEEVKVVEDKVKYYIQYGNDVDKRTIPYLEEILKCGSIDSNLDYNYYSKVENLIAVGGVPSNFGKFSGYTKYWIKGTDRIDTASRVIEVAKKLSKGGLFETVMAEYKIK